MLSERFKTDVGKLTLNVGGRSHQLVPCTELEGESRQGKDFHPLLLCDCRQIGAEPPIPTPRFPPGRTMSFFKPKQSLCQSKALSGIWLWLQAKQNTSRRTQFPKWTLPVGMQPVLSSGSIQLRDDKHIPRFTNLNDKSSTKFLNNG